MRSRRTSIPGTSRPITFSRNTTWVKASGKATLYTYAIVHRPFHPGFVGDLPFVTAMVELEEGPIMPTNIVMDDPTPEKLQIGMALEVVFEEHHRRHLTPQVQACIAEQDTIIGWVF